jgi:hypothetical protein
MIKPPPIFLVRAARDDLQRIVRQRPLQRLCLVHGARIQMSCSSSVVKITGIAFGWIGSITAFGVVVRKPGAVEVTLDCLPGSALPEELRKLGYDVTETGEGERILPAAIVERFVRRADGELEPLTPGSTAVVAETRAHAGIVTVRR